ncbi:MAG: polyprenyl synthetase family protein, partial [Spirochaetota bacterium]|nr:polyprenyl synthetase family protein [Spirochaetota bacterium]
GDLRLLKLIADTATELSEGEILEVMKTNDIGITEQDYIQIVTRKTAVLFSAACQSGAILGNVSAQEILALKQFGSNLGIAFQLVDDLLDFVGEGSEFGKSIGKDLQEGKITLPLIFALRVCKKSERAYLSDIITKRSFESSFDYVLDVVKRQGGIDYTEELAREYIQKAKECLSIFPSNSGRDALLAIADFVIQRRF